MPGETLAFDLFGTLVDPASQKDVLAPHVENAAEVAAAWRRHQLEITWLLSLMERYESFAAVTAHALQAALDEAGVDLREDAWREILDGARVPTLFEDVPEALAELRRSGHELAVFSNGAAEQQDLIVRETGIARYFSSLVSVEDVRVYKPAPRVYEHAAQRLGRPIGDLWLVTGNAFDAAGAKAAGMRVAKLERGGSLRYAFAPPPDLIVATLRELPAALEDFAGS